jgi:hypothetical protein
MLLEQLQILRIASQRLTLAIERLDREEYRALDWCHLYGAPDTISAIAT